MTPPTTPAEALREKWAAYTSPDALSIDASYLLLAVEKRLPALLDEHERRGKALEAIEGKARSLKDPGGDAPEYQRRHFDGFFVAINWAANIARAALEQETGR